MKIAEIATFHTSASLALVRVRTDDGAEGWGQTSAYLADLAVEMLHTRLARWFIGTDARDLEATETRLVRTEYKHWGTVLFRALCGIDTAIWDLLGRVSGVPVYRLLGGAVRTRLPVYGSSMVRHLSAGEETERMLALRERHGFEAFKLRVGEPMGEDRESWPGRDRELIVRARADLGDGVDLLADANGGFTPGRAIAVGRLLEEQGYVHFEEPCPYDQYEQTAQVARVLDIPVAGGEQDYSLPQLRRIVTTGVVDIVQPDVGYIGGVSRMRQVAVMAEAAGIPFTAHCANRSLLQIFSLHVAAAAPAATQRQEWSIENVAWTDDLFSGLPEVRDGHVELSEGPGWGIEIDRGFLRRARQRTSGG